MKNLKKLLALLLTVSMLTGLLGTAVFAADPETIPVEKEPSGETGAENADNALPAPAAEEPEQTEAQKLQAAISAATDGAETTITMTADIVGMTTAEIITIPAGKVIVLNMAGHSITVAKDFSGRVIQNQGTLTVQGNGTIDASGSLDGWGAINNTGTLTVENGTFRGNSEAGASNIRNYGENAALVINDGTFDTSSTAVLNYDGLTTLNGGTYTTHDHNCSTCGNNWSYVIRTYTDGNEGVYPRLYVNGGTYTGTQGAMSSSTGYIEINGGTFKTVPCGQGHTAVYYALYAAGEYGDVQCIINGGTFETVGKNAAVLLGNDNTNGDGGINADALSHIYGGTFIAPEGVPAVTVSPNTAKASVIHGGSYTLLTEAAQAYLDPATKTEVKEGKTEVVSRPENDEDAVAKSGTAVYASLQAAIDAAPEGGEVKLLKDAYETVVIDKDLTLNGAEKKIVLNRAAAQNMTAISGINGETTPYSAIVAATNGADVTLKNLTVKGVPAEVSEVPALTHNSRYIGVAALEANVTMEDCTVTDICYTDHLKGMQNGLGIYAVSANPTALMLENVSVTNFNKGGIVTRANVNLVMDGCTVTGWGETDVISQNGIQYSGNATIRNTTISSLKYVADNEWSGGAMAIMNYPGSTPTTSVIEGVTCTNVDYAIGTYENGTTEIKSGNFNGKVWGDESTLAISGGTFSTDVDEYCTDTCMAKVSEDGRYHIVSRTASKLTTDIGEKTFFVGQPVEFSFTTVANSDAGRMVIGTSDFSNADAVDKLEYYEVRDGQWHELSGDFGSAAGFPMSNATSKFRVTFKTEGAYKFTASMKLAENGKVLCSTEVAFNVYAADSVAVIGSTGYPTLQAALAAAKSGDTVTLVKDITVDSTAGKNQATISIPAQVTLDGGNHTITAGTFANSAHMLGVINAGGVKVMNLTVDMNKAADSKHALNVHGANASVTLENVTLKNANTAGMVVNTGTVKADQLTTEGNGWGGINVDKGGNFTATELTANEPAMVWSEDYGTDGGSTVEIDGFETVYGVARGKVHFMTVEKAEEVTVAKIGDARYATLQAAIDAAAEDDIIVLANDVTESVTVGTDKNITLDLDGKTLTAAGGYAITNYGTLVLTGKGTVYQPEGGIIVIENGWYEGTGRPGDAVASLTIENGSITGGASSVRNCKFGKLTIENGSFIGAAQSAVWNSGSNATTSISGGIFSSDVTKYCVTGKSAVKQADGNYLVCLTGTVEALNEGGTVNGSTVTYGTGTTLQFTPEGNALGRDPNHWWAGIKVIAPEGASKNAKYQVKEPWVADFRTEDWSKNADGTFWAPADQAYIDRFGGEAKALTFTYQFDWDDDGVYDQTVTMTVEDGIEHNMTGVVAKTGGLYYGTLQAAIDAAKAEQTVTLVKDASGAGIIVNKSITIDFDGKSYTVAEAPLAGSTGTKTQAFQLLAGDNKMAPNTVTMKRGTIVLPGTTAGLRMGIQNYTDLTLDGMTLDASNNSNITYVLSNNNGRTKITGGTVLKAAEGQVAFDVYDYSSNGYGAVSVEVDDATVSGKIEVSDSEKASLTITGGTYSTDVNAYCADGYVAPKTGETYTVKARVTPSELSTDIGEKTFVVGNAVEFNFTATANGDADVMVLGTSTFNDTSATLEYYEVKDGNWYALSGDFGPRAGFPMSDATSTFRVTFKTAGEYTFTASMKTAVGGKTLCSTDVTFTVHEAVAKIGDTNYESLQAAAAAQTAEQTITLLRETTLTEALTLNGPLTLNADLTLNAALTLNGGVNGGAGKLRVTLVGDVAIVSSESILDHVVAGVAAPEAEIIENGNSTDGYSYRLAAPVAQVDGVNYATLQDAIDAAADGETVTLLASTAKGANIPAGKTLILDLGGEFTLSNTSGKGVVTSAGDLTITNGTIQAANSGKVAAVYATGGSVTLADDATLKGSYGIMAFDTTVTVNGSITANKTALSLGNASAQVNAGAALQQSGINSATVELVGGQLTVTGGEIRGGTGIRADAASSLTVTGGSFYNMGDRYFNDFQTEELHITGGSFASDVGARLPEGYLTLLENGMYTVTEATLAIGQSTASLYPNDTVTLTVTPANAAGLTWTSSNAAVATVNNGTVTALAVGQTTITATISNGSTVTCAVTVQERPSPVIPGGGGGNATIDDEDVPLASVLPFDDVADADWFHDAVAYVYDRELMVGVTDNLFAPYNEITRGMIVSILYRLDGSPEIAETDVFGDVAAGQWYSKGVAWAAAHEIVLGYGDGTFAPNKNITREELAAILYRYAAYKGYTVTVAADAALNFTDAAEVSAYAEPALLWAVENGLINGMGDGTVCARSGATRAQAATILQNFCGKYVDEK